MTKNLGQLVLAAWLIIHGLTSLINLSFQYQAQILGALAVAAGVLIVLKK